MAEWQWQIKLVVGLKPKQQLIKFLVARPWAEIGRKSGGRRVLALNEQLEGEGIEYGNWMVGMGGRGWRGGHISSGGIWSAWNIPEKLQLTRGSKYANTDTSEDDLFCHLECLQSKKKLWRVNQVYNKVSGWWDCWAQPVTVTHLTSEEPWHQQPTIHCCHHILHHTTIPD